MARSPNGSNTTTAMQAAVESESFTETGIAHDNAPAESDTQPMKESAEEKPGGFCVYIGPSILGVIQSGTVLVDSDVYAQKMKEAAVSKYPLVKTLLVRGERLADARVKVKTPGNSLYVNYNRLVAAVKSI